MTSKIVAFMTQKTLTHTLKSQYTQNESLFGADFGPDAYGPFFFENEQGVAVTVNGDRYRAMLNVFLFTKGGRGYWQHLVSTGRLYLPHSRSYTRCFYSIFKKKEVIWRTLYFKKLKRIAGLRS